MLLDEKSYGNTKSCDDLPLKSLIKSTFDENHNNS